MASMTGIVEHAPSLALSAAVASQDFYAVIFSDATAMRMAVGDAAMQQAAGGGLRAVAIDSTTGKIVEHGVLQTVSWVNVAAFATAAWTVLTVLVGKKYLADISARLDSISSGLQSIRSMMENEMEGWLHGTVATLRRHLSELQDEKVSPAYAQGLLSNCLQISREARQRWTSLSLSHAAAVDDVEQLTCRPFMSEDAVLRSAQAVRLLHARAAALDVATQIRAGCEHMQSSLGLATVEGADELKGLAASIVELQASDRKVLKKLTSMVQVGDRPALFGRDKYDTAQRQTLDAAAHLDAATFTGHSYCNSVSTHIRKGFLSNQRITVLLRRSVEGEVTEARMLTRNA